MQFASRACTLSVVSHCFRRKISNIIDTRIVLYANDRNFSWHIYMAIVHLHFIKILLTDFLICVLLPRMRANTTTASGGPIRERGIMFFRQSCILGLIYIMYTLLMVIHPFVFTNKWVLFLASTVAWILVQSIDGLTFLIFNCNLICKVNSGVVTTAPATNWVQTTRLN
ncbi:Serpentine receptor class X [Dirofilaria immitis]